MFKTNSILAILVAVLACGVWTSEVQARNGWTRSCYLETFPGRSYGGYSDLIKVIMTCSQRQGTTEYHDAVPFYFCDAGTPGNAVNRELVIAAGGNNEPAIVFAARNSSLRTLNYYSHVQSGVYDAQRGKVDFTSSPGSPASSCNNIKIADPGNKPMYFTFQAFELFLNRVMRHFTDCHISSNCMMSAGESPAGEGFYIFAKNYNYDSSGGALNNFVDKTQPGYAERPVP